MTFAPGLPPPPEAPLAPVRQDGRYAIAVLITIAAVLSQYVVPRSVPALLPLYSNFASGLFIIYGIPILGFVVLIGFRPLRGWASQLGRATWEGLRWYGLLSALGFIVLFTLTVLYLVLDPRALQLLSRPNPVLESARGNPWFWVAFSFAIGGFEELIFRGWIFGYWRGRPGVHWVTSAAATSALFAGVHLYYAFTYAAAAPLIFPDLFLLGFAFAAAVHASGGNLVIVALLHGANDATAFLTLINTTDAILLHYGLIGIGLLIALLTYARKSSAPPIPPIPWSPQGPSPAFPPDPYAILGPAPPPPGVPPPPSAIGVCGRRLTVGRSERSWGVSGEGDLPRRPSYP